MVANQSLTGESIQTGARSTVAVRGKEIVVEVLEITGLMTSMDDKVHGMTNLTVPRWKSARP